MPLTKPPRAPKNLEQATALCELIASLDAQAAGLTAQRDAAIAATNATADAVLAPLLEERAAIAGVIEAWWLAGGNGLLKGKRKTMLLGGCDIGTKKAPVALTFTDDDFDAAVTALRAERWAKPYVRVTYAVAKKDTAAALDGKHGEQLRGMGFATRGGSDVFVLAAAKRTDTLAA